MSERPSPSGRPAGALPALPGIVWHLAGRSLAESRVSFFMLVAAVAAGVGFQVPNRANMDGYHAALLEHGIDLGYGDVRIRPGETPFIEDAAALIARVSAEPGVDEAVGVLMFPGAVGKGGVIQGVPLFGYDTGARHQPFRITEGERLDPGDESGLLLGTLLAARLGVEVGDEVDLRAVLTPADGLAAREGGEEPDLGTFDMKVRGLVTGVWVSYQAVFVDRGLLDREAALDGAVSMVLVYLRDHRAADGTAARLAAERPDLRVRPWREDDRFLDSAIGSIDAIAGVSEAMVVFAVAIPVLSLLYINVLRRRRDVGVLCSLGFVRREIFGVFATQALLVGLLGVAIGIGLGLCLCWYFDTHPLFDYHGFVIRPVLTWGAFLRPALVVLFTTLVAGAYPAWVAARVDPARVLRGLE